MTIPSGILCLDVKGWTLSVMTHADGFEVGISDETKCPTTFYVRLDAEQSETLWEFLNEMTSAPVTNGERQ